MRKGIFLLVLSLLLSLTAGGGWAAPLTMAPDLAGRVEIPLTDGGVNYVYSYAYPQLEAGDGSAELINTFYQSLARDAEEFEIPRNADYYRGQQPAQDVTVDITYEITCNNEEFFSVLLHTRQGTLRTVAGHVFSRKGIKAGSSVALPYLLALLDSGESDTWLQDRQTARADAAVREMVWDSLQCREDVSLLEDLDREALEYVFFPEEDFYLDESGNPVFYLQPGVADGGEDLLVFPFTVEDILDEM